MTVWVQNDFVLKKCGKTRMFYEEGDIWDLRYGGISLFFLRYYGIFLEKLRYYDIGNLAVHGISNFGLKNCGN
jgi:hypothetical protein